MGSTSPLSEGSAPIPSALGAPGVAELGGRTGRNYEKLQVAGAIVVYVVAISAMPIWNKAIFSGQNDAVKFPYPIATAFLQLGGISIILGLLNIFGHYGGDPDESWVLGPHLLYKLRNTAPIGLLFGVKYGITNWGLQLIPTGQHLLLASTDIVWTLLTAWCVNNEPLGVLKQCVCALMTAGSVLVGINCGQTLDAPAVGLLVNLATPFSMALCISLLRKNTLELFREDNPIRGTMSPIEFTSLKLFLSASVALLLSLYFEGGYIQLPTGAADHMQASAWWDAIDGSPTRLAFVLLGAVWPLIFQVNLTWLAGVTSASTCGILGGCRVIPQWVLNALFTGHFNTSPLQVVGTALVFFASVLYASAATQYSLNSAAAPLRADAGPGEESSRCTTPSSRQPLLPSCLRSSSVTSASSRSRRATFPLCGSHSSSVTSLEEQLEIYGKQAEHYALFDPDGLPWWVRTGVVVVDAPGLRRVSSPSILQSEAESSRDLSCSPKRRMEKYHTWSGPRHSAPLPATPSR